MSKTTPPLYLRQLLTCRWRQSLPPVPFASRRQRRENNNVINKTKATKSYYRKISTSDHLSTKRQSGHCCVTVITSDRLMSKMNKWSINSIIFLYTEPFALSDCFLLRLWAWSVSWVGDSPLDFPTQLHCVATEIQFRRFAQNWDQTLNNYQISGLSNRVHTTYLSINHPESCSLV